MGAKALKTTEIRARLFRIKKSGDDVIINIDHVKSSKNSSTVQVTKGKSIVLKGVLSKHISDEEFTQRNSRFNEEIDRLRLRLDELEQERSKNREMLQSSDVQR